MTPKCSYCDDWGVLEGSEDAFCPHCITGQDVEEYFKMIDQGFFNAMEIEHEEK